MIIGYQVVDTDGRIAQGTKSNVILDESRAISVLEHASRTSPGQRYYIKAIVSGQIESPEFASPWAVPINTLSELEALAREFEGDVTLADDFEKAGDDTVRAARRLIQGSCRSHSTVVPDAVQSIPAGDGSGEWVPALVFVSNGESASEL